MSKTAVRIAVVAALCGIFYFLLDLSVSIEPSRITLGDITYNIKALSAPAMSGHALAFTSYLLSQSIFGAVLRRKLLNDNHVEELRDVGSQIPLPPTHFPLHRVGDDDWNTAYIHAQANNGVVTASLTNNILLNASTSKTYYSIIDYAKAYATGKLTPLQVVNETLQVIKQWERDGFGVFSHYIEEDVLNQAAQSTLRHQLGGARSILDGVPVAFKDMMDIRHHYVCNGHRNHIALCKIAEKDDTIVARFRAAGAIIMGLTLMTEGGMSPLGFNVHYQGPVSAFHPEFYSGGSSSGSALAVATGLVPLAIGFDGGGSIRIPSSMSGIHGLASTFGRIPFDSALEFSTLKCGPMAAHAADAAIGHIMMSEAEADHFYSNLYDAGKYGPPLPHIHRFHSVQDLSDVRIGVFEEWFSDAEPEVVEACLRAQQALLSRGATIVPIAIPHLHQMSLSHGMIISSEFALLWDKIIHTTPELLEPNTRISVAIGSTITALELLSAEKIRTYALNFVHELFASQNLTFIATPTISLKPPIIGKETYSHGINNIPVIIQLLKYVFPANLLGLPAYSVPVGYTKGISSDGPVDMPIGYQLLGNHWSEHDLIRVAHALDMEFGALRKRPPRFHDALAVV